MGVVIRLARRPWKTIVFPALILGRQPVDRQTDFPVPSAQHPELIVAGEPRLDVILHALLVSSAGSDISQHWPGSALSHRTHFQSSSPGLKLRPVRYTGVQPHPNELPAGRHESVGQDASTA